MVVVMVMMPLLVLRPRMVHVVHYQFGPVAHALHPGRRVRFLAPAARLMVMVVVVLLARVLRGRSRLV
jgi:hypothetical protein